MQTTPKTIQIFLPGGDPQGIRVAELTTRIVQVIEVPRSLLQDFLKMPESDQVAVYFLIGKSEDGAEQRVYIGQTGDLRGRMTKHNKEKDFWERALVLISRTNSLTQTHALFLEWQCLQAVRAAGRFSDENGNSGSRPHTPSPMEADCLEIFDTGRTLLSTLGYPLFIPVAKPGSEPTEDEIFYCKADGNEGRGIYTQEGFVVLKGSTGRKENVKSLKPTGEKMRSKLINAGVVSSAGDQIVFDKDYPFGSPSAHVSSVEGAGSKTDGWNGKTGDPA